MKTRFLIAALAAGSFCSLTAGTHAAHADYFQLSFGVHNAIVLSGTDGADLFSPLGGDLSGDRFELGASLYVAPSGGSPTGRIVTLAGSFFQLRLIEGGTTTRVNFNLLSGTSFDLAPDGLSDTARFVVGGPASGEISLSDNYMNLQTVPFGTGVEQFTFDGTGGPFSFTLTNAIGSTTISVAQTNAGYALTPSLVPLPSAAPLFGASLLALGAVGYAAKRKKAAAAA